MTDSQIREALMAFRITPDRIEATPGNTTSLWRVDSGDSSYVLRRHPVDSVARMGTTHDLLHFLATRFHRAPEAQSTPDGREFLERPEGVYELLTYLPGDVAVTGWDFDWDDDQFLQSAARLSAELNLVLRDYKLPTDAVWHQPNVMPGRDEVKTFLLRDKTSESKTILTNLELVYTYLEAFPADTTPRHVIHNDFAWYNVVRREHSAVGVIDCDSAQAGSELCDIAYAVYAFAPIRDSIKSEARSFRRTAERVALFMASFEERLGERLRLQPETLVDAAAYRVALSGANLIAGYLQGEERSKRLVSHAVGYSEWLRWYETSRSQLIGALEQVQ